MSIRYTNNGTQSSKTLTQDRYKYYESFVLSQMKNIIGNPSNIIRLIFFNEIGEVTTLEDKSSNAKNATLSQNAITMNPQTFKNAKSLVFDTDADYYEFADSDDLSFGDGAGNDDAFSIVWLGKPVFDSSNRLIVQKDNKQTNNREYHFGIDSTNRYRFFLFNNDSSALIGRRFNSTDIGDANSHHCIIGTYDGSKVSTGLKVYRDGTQVDDTNFSTGYTGMTNGSAKLASYGIESDGSAISFQHGTNVFLMIIKEELSEAKVKQIDAILRRSVGVI